MAGIGWAHVWFCVWFPYVLALGLAKRCLDGWVDSMFWGFVGSELRLNTVLGVLLLEPLLWLGWVVGMWFCVNFLCVRIGFGVFDVVMHVHSFRAYMHLWGSGTPWAGAW